MERKNLFSGATNYKSKRSKTLATYDDFVHAIKGTFVPSINPFTKECFLRRPLPTFCEERLSFSMGLVSVETFLTKNGYKFSFAQISRWYNALFTLKENFSKHNAIEDYCRAAISSNHWSADPDDKEEVMDHCWGVVENFCNHIFSEKRLSNLLQKSLIQQMIINLGLLGGAASDFVPVLQGRQGTGKSRFIATLQPVPELFLGEVSAANLTIKDSLIELTSHAAVELAEIETTLGKNSCGIIKAFLTRGKDQFRKPYAVEAELFLRYCAFWGTTNSKEFLQDQTGNRRFVVFPFTFNATKREKILDYIQENKRELWGAIYSLVTNVENIEQLGWRLTPEELAENERQNEGYKKQPRGTAELLDLIEEGPANWQGTASELKEMFPATLGNLSLTTIGSRLKEIPGVELLRKNNLRLYKLCLRKFVDYEQLRINAIIDNCKKCLLQFIVPVNENKANWLGKEKDLIRILDGFSLEHFDDDILHATLSALEKEKVVEEHPDGWKYFLAFKPNFLPSIRFGSINPEVM